MKKVLVVLIIIAMTLLTGATVFLGFTIFQNKGEIDNLKKKAEEHEQENGEYKNKIDNMETKISELAQLLLKDSTENQNEVNNEINNTNTDENKTSNYEIVKELPEGITFNQKTKGAEMAEKDGIYYVIIKMGEKSTGGYSIEVVNVEINDKNANIYVKENNPDPTSTVTQAFTYPYVVVKFNFKPNVKIIYNN
jgi:flagellar basal body-associated protein FliL